MEFETTQELSRKHLSAYGENITITKHANGSYKQRHHGIFHNGRKVLERLSLSVNGAFLDRAVKSYAKLWGIKQIHSLKDINVERSILPKKDSCLDVIHLTNMAQKRQTVSLELHIELSKNNPHRRIFDHLREALLIEQDDLHILLGIGRTDKEVSILHPYKKDRIMHHSHKIHTDQSLSGYRISFVLEPSESIAIPLIIAFSDSKEEVCDIFDTISADWKGLQIESIQSSHLHDKIDTPSLELNRAFTWSVHLLNQLGKHPFQLSRQDIIWISSALLDLGRYDESTRLVEKLHSKDPLLFYFAATQLAEYLDDMEMIKRLEPLLTAAKRSCVLHNYVVEEDENKYAVESPNNLSSSIEMQSLWSEALKTTYMRTSYLLKRELARTFWDPETETFYSHPLTKKTTSAENIDSRFLLPLAFGQIDREIAHKALDGLKRKYLSLHGISLKPRDSKGSKYLKETSYSTFTGLAACAFFQYGRVDEGSQMLLDLSAHADKEHAGHIAESHAIKNGSSLGESINVAAHALLIHVVDTWLFGIRTKGNKIIISPNMPSEWHEMKRKHKLSVNNHLTLSIRRDGPAYEGEIKVQGKGEPLIELILPVHIKEINVNGKTQKGHTIIFRPDEVNLFVAKA